MDRDLISRKALVAALLEERDKYPPDIEVRNPAGEPVSKQPSRFNQAVRGAIRMALRLVETAPAVDGAEIVSVATWVKCYSFPTRNFPPSNKKPAKHGIVYQCSSCGFYSGFPDVRCRCGAKMKMEDDSE